MLWMGIWLLPYTVMIFCRLDGCISKSLRYAWGWVILYCPCWSSKQTQIASHSIHIICKCAKCFSTLLCCGLSYGSILTLLRFFAGGSYHMLNIQSVLAPCYIVDGQMGPPLHCYTCAAGGASWILGVVKSVWQHSLRYVCSSLTDIVRSLLRLEANTDCTPQHQYHM